MKIPHQIYQKLHYSPNSSFHKNFDRFEIIHRDYYVQTWRGSNGSKKQLETGSCERISVYILTARPITKRRFDFGWEPTMEGG